MDFPGRFLDRDPFFNLGDFAMKKSLLALAVLGAFASAASAQSSVTLSGSVDAGVKALGSNYSLGGSQSGYNAFTISGKEDLGGGMNAFFVLNHRFNIANGKQNTSTTSGANDVFWRNSFVGLGGGFGDVRLGRMLMPLQDMNGGFDAFDTGYVGSTHTGGATATVRANNAIYYRSPNFGGLTFHAAIAAAEGQYLAETSGTFAAGGAAFSIPSALLNSERPQGLSLRYAAGPLNLGVAWDKNTGDYDTIGVYGSYNFGFMTLFGQYETGTINNAAGTAEEDTDAYSISAKIPMGAFTWKVGYLGLSSSRANGDGYKLGGGVEYALSKRTSLYSNIGQVGGDRPTGTQDDFQFDIGITHKF
jgi:predicted porin